MEKLPDEILLMIFDRVPSRDLFSSTALVCRRWAALARQRILLLEQPEDVGGLHRRIDTIRVVTRLPAPKAFLNKIAQVAPFLRDLTVYAVCPFGSEHFEAIARLRHLEHLDIFLRDRALDTRLLPALIRLTSLVINEIVSARVLRALAITKWLRGLHLFGRALYYPRREILVFLREKQYHLSELTLRCTELQDAAYVAIGQCENLLSLQLYSCWLVTGDGLLHTTRPRRLRKLHVTGAKMVRNVALVTFIDNLPINLEELDLSAGCFGEEHIARLAHRVPRLRVLELWQCRLSSAGVIKLAEAMQELISLDLDILLTNQEIQDIDRTHPSLLHLRCLTEHSVRNDAFTPSTPTTAEVSKPVTCRIKVIPTNARYPFKYFRGSGEGYRGSLYYYWTQGMELDPLHSDLSPAYDDEDDFY